MNLFVLVIFESITARDGFFSIVDSFFLSDELIRFLCETSAECLSSWGFFCVVGFSNWFYCPFRQFWVVNKWRSLYFYQFFRNFKNLAFILFGLFVSLIDDQGVKLLRREIFIIHVSLIFSNHLKKKYKTLHDPIYSIISRSEVLPVLCQDFHIQILFQNCIRSLKK